MVVREVYYLKPKHAQMPKRHQGLELFAWIFLPANAAPEGGPALEKPGIRWFQASLSRRYRCKCDRLLLAGPVVRFTKTRLDGR